jgi:hypothetical protein
MKSATIIYTLHAKMTLWLWMDITFKVKDFKKVDINKCLFKHVVCIITHRHIIILNKQIMIMMNKQICCFNAARCQMITKLVQIL